VASMLSCASKTEKFLVHVGSRRKNAKSRSFTKIPTSIWNVAEEVRSSKTQQLRLSWSPFEIPRRVELSSRSVKVS
jgi:hypothetical protein